MRFDWLGLPVRVEISVMVSVTHQTQNRSYGILLALWGNFRPG